MKSSVYHGRNLNKKDYDPRAPVIRGVRLEKEQLELNAKFGKVSAEEFEVAKEEFFALIKTKAEGGKQPSKIVELHQKHGDMIVMHGAELQKNFVVC